MSGQKTYEMLWDCPACGAAGLLGLTHRHCPSCGGAQDPARRYYPDEAQKVAVEDHRFHGADVVCGACETPNGAAAAFCVGCGAPLDGAKSVATRATLGEGVEDSAAKALAEHRAQREAEQRSRQAAAAAASGAPVPAPRASGGASKLALGCGALLVLGCAGVAVAVFWKQDVAVEVTGHSWERSIVVEAFKTVSESAWRDSVPSGARGVSCRREQRGTEQVPDGETCTTQRSDNGDGTYSEKEACTPRYRDSPTYDEKCSFEVDRWVKVDTAVARGASLAETPSWPTLALAGGKREGKRSESYTVTFKGPEDVYSCEVAEAKWSTLTVGSRWKAQAGVLTGALDCDALTPAR